MQGWRACAPVSDSLSCLASTRVPQKAIFHVSIRVCLAGALRESIGVQESEHLHTNTCLDSLH